MRYGIYDIEKVEKNEAVVKCNNCYNFFYEEIADERNNNGLEIFCENDEFFRGCPVCKTDEYLADVELREG
jgi:Pyruvate/2-oxoacid:ferredoxin oxidoreductase delta subunit